MTTDSDDNYRPSYLALHATGELVRRVEALERLLERCTVCPLDCGNDPGSISLPLQACGGDRRS